jgi:type I restriction enzyme S subunit
MGKYKPYPAYKESGIEWLGQVPEHWVIKQLIRTVSGNTNGIWGQEPRNDGSDTVVLRVADFNRDTLSLKEHDFTTRQISKTELVNRRLKKGDLLLEKSGGGEKTLVGQVVLFDKEIEAVTSNFVAKMTPLHGNLSEYLNFVFSHFYSTNINYCSIKQNTGIQNIDADSYLRESFAFPSIEEQTQIANFLDRETRKIESLIEKQQTLIELLKEKRQAVISHAVTKGLNPNAKMKDSGIEWLGEIPEYWVVSKFAYLSLVVRGGSPRPAGDPKLFNGTYSPWVTVAEITKDDNLYLNETETFLTELGSKQCRVFKKGTLLLSNSGATLGVPKILNIDANANDGVVGFESLSQKLNIKFAYYFLLSITENLREMIKQGSGQPNLNTDIVKNISIPLPPVQEQLNIVAYVSSQTKKIDTLIDKSQQAIELLKERKTALISAAVTGKIDVRELVQ